MNPAMLCYPCLADWAIGFAEEREWNPLACVLGEDAAHEIQLGFITASSVAGVGWLHSAACRKLCKWSSKTARTVIRSAERTAPRLSTWAFRDVRRRLRESVVNLFVTNYNNDDVRTYWQTQAQLKIRKATPGHSHPISAAERTAAANLIDGMSLALGRGTYVVSSCRRENPLAPTSHGWYIDKDPAFPPRHDPIPPNAIVKMVDVDYYIDWKVWARQARPIALYTFVPQDVTYSDAEMSYALTPSGVHMHVNGGATYVHQLWDYSNDHLSVQTSYWKKLVYSVSVKRVGQHHRLVLLTPLYSVRFFGGFIHTKPIERMDFRFGNLGVAHTYRSPLGDRISLGLCSGGRAISSVTLTVEQLEAMRIRLAASKNRCIGDVERHLSQIKDEAPATRAPPLFAILMAGGLGPYRCPTDMAGTFAPLRYQVTFKQQPVSVNDDGKDVGRQVAPSLVAYPDLLPLRCFNNDLASVVARVTSALNTTVPPPKYLVFAQEFVGHLVPQRNLGRRLDIDDVIAIQNRPAQRGRSEKVKNWLAPPGNARVQSFMKGESYSKPAAPRNISTLPTDHGLQLSAYTYPFKSDVLKSQAWYAPCKRPAEIAERVIYLAQNATHLAETDYTTFDGTQSEWLKTNVSHASHLAWVHPDQAADLVALFRAEDRAHAVTSQGVRYDPGWSQRSGSPTTTDDNSITNAFVSYAGARLSGLSPKLAWQALGIYAGDDGLTPIEPGFVAEAASALGLKLKCISVKGDFSFLGRVFFHADSGQLGSIQDPERTWRKLHLTFAPRSIDDTQALANRTAGYLALDPQVPVTSDWCHAVRRIIGIDGEITADAPYFAWLASLDGQFGGWPQMPRQLAYEAIAWRTGRYPQEVCDLVDKIRSAKTLDDLANLWTNPETPCPYDCLVDGNVRPGTDKEPEANKPRTRRRPPSVDDGACPSRGNVQGPVVVLAPQPRRGRTMARQDNRRCAPPRRRRGP